MIADEMIGEPELEIEIRTLMNRIPPAQPFFVDQRGVKTIKTFEFFRHVSGVERVLDLAQRGVTGLVEKILVAKEPLSQIFFQRLFETKLLCEAQSEPIEPVTNIAREQFVSALAREHDRHAALSRRCRKRHRASAVSLFHGGLAA